MSSAHAVQDATANGRGGKFLTFSLAGKEYGIEILKVHEIIGMMPITRVPRTPDMIRGVINLRGTVIPIADLRRKFDMESVSGAGETVIIVVQVHGIQTGLVVDSVSEVMHIASRDVEDAPSFGGGIDTDYLLGLARENGRVKLLLDIDCVLSGSDAQQLRAGEVLTQLEEIAAQVNRVGEMMGEIAAASEQQNDGVSQINSAVEQMSGVTQAVAANSEESASAAEELSSQADRVRELVGGFAVGGRSAEAGPSRARQSKRAAYPGHFAQPTSPRAAVGRVKPKLATQGHAGASHSAAGKGHNGAGKAPNGAASVIRFDDDGDVLGEF